MKRKLFAGIAIIGALAATPLSDAEARPWGYGGYGGYHHRGGFGAGFVGGLLGGAVASSLVRPSYGYGGVGYGYEAPPPVVVVPAPSYGYAYPTYATPPAPVVVSPYGAPYAVASPYPYGGYRY